MARTSQSPVDVAYDHVREIALRFPAADEKLSHGCPSFHVRGKMFLMFVGEAYGRGVAVWCKATLEEQRARVATDAERYFVPPYVGVKGWVGVSVDPKSADWIDLSILVEDAWRSVAPPRVVRGEAAPERARAAPVTRVTRRASASPRSKSSSAIVDLEPKRDHRGRRKGAGMRGVPTGRRDPRKIAR